MHQWTGNLITCSWWDEIWINEAFADIGGYFGLRYAEPEIIWENQMVFKELFTALRADASITSRPIINKQNNNDFVVESPSEISRQFDNIAYAKGGSINKMVIHAMEERRWQHGMRVYLKENQYENTDGEIYFAFMQMALDDLEATDKVSYHLLPVRIYRKYIQYLYNILGLLYSIVLNLYFRNGIFHMDSIKHLTVGTDKWDIQL